MKDNQFPLFPPYLLAQRREQLTAPLYLTFNKTFSRHFPILWKSSHLMPIYKNSNRQSDEDFHAIAIRSS